MNDCSYNSQCFEVEDNQSTDAEIVIQVHDSDNDGNQEEVVDDNEEESLWSIDDDTFFQPLGLINHGTEGKSVFVTWSENYLLNFVFKKSKKSEHTKLTKVRIDVHAEEIRQILILELNTLLLMQSGRVFYFSSVKSMHPVDWLQGVRCISAALGGFSVIRLLEDNTLRLETYQDVTNIERSKSTLKQSFDITFDESNLFNCQWLDEHLTLQSQYVDQLNINFLESCIGYEIKLKIKQEIHFFTVSGSVYALIPESENNSDVYNIQLCATYASTIKFMKLLCKRNLCLVFLQCGSIDIWYMSHITEGIRRTSHCTGSIIVHYEFSDRNDCFYYTDAEKVAQLKFKYDPEGDICLVQETSKSIYGILACTWVESIQQLICLSSNNIFYQLAFDDKCNEADKSENLSNIYELTGAKMSHLLEQAHLLNELQTAPAEIHKLIENEFVKQQLMAVARKVPFFSKLCTAYLEFRKFLPPVDKETVIIHTSTDCIVSSNSCFALLNITIAKNDIFLAASIWNLHITSNTGDCYALSITHDMMHRSLCVVIPQIRQSQKLLPEFQITLNAFIENEQDFLSISLPIDVKNSFSCFKHLFSTLLTSLNKPTTQNLTYLMASFKKQKETHKKQISSVNLALTKACSFSAILRLFNAEHRGSAETQPRVLNLYFLSEHLKISHSLEDNCINLECSDVAIVFYAKYLILGTLQNLYSPILDESKTKSLMQYQAEIERNYGQLSHDNNTVYKTLHLENLQSIYTKLRKDFCKT